jgi:hypothetical protein
MNRRKFLVIAVGLLGSGAVACGSTSSAVPAPTNSRRPAELPGELVGAWHMITERNSASSYEFAADGRFTYLSIMKSPGQQYTLQERGRATARGNKITMTPEWDLLSKSDPAQTASPSATNHDVRGPRTLTWSVSEQGLTLSGGTGAPSHYERG